MEQSPNTPSRVEIFETAPPHFVSKMDVVGCFVFCHERLLLLKRDPNKPQPNTWCVPGGKVERNELLEKAVIREVYEETGLGMQGAPRYIGAIYVRYPEIDFTYHMFQYDIDKHSVEIKMNREEHSEFFWATIEEALHLPLIPGGRECILIFQKSQKTQLGTRDLLHSP
jgi:8-oxo-dGTP pyrophosphatase MutT (NUDIX family)